MGHDPETEAPGWAAISQAFSDLYGSQEPMHVAPSVGPAIGGAALQGVSAYLHPEGHWHFVGYGLSELYEKISDLPDQSGWGFELTMRVARPWDWKNRPPPEASAPMWPMTALQTIALFVERAGQPIPPGVFLAHRPPKAPWIAGFISVADPAFDVVETPNGKLRFLQLVGLDAARYERVQRSPEDMTAVVGELSASSRFLVTPGA